MSSVRTAGTKNSKVSKRDRDLEVMAAMAPVAAANRAEKRDIEERSFTLIVTRIVGAFSLLFALLLVVVCAVTLSIDCCGDHFRYRGDELWKEECETAADQLADDDSNSQWSCYHRNLGVLVSFCFALFLAIVGGSIIVAGQCLYGTARAESNQEQGIEDLAAAVKTNHIENRLAEREEARVLREERAAARAAEAAERREQTRAAAAASQNRYAGARRYSVGAPATVAAPTVYGARPVNMSYTQTVRPSPVYSQSVHAPRAQTQVQTTRYVV